MEKQCRRYNQRPAGARAAITCRPPASRVQLIFFRFNGEREELSSEPLTILIAGLLQFLDQRCFSL